MNRLAISGAALIALILGAGGATWINKAAKVPCPACNCPATISLMGAVDIGRLNNKKGNFYYQPEVKGPVYLILSEQDTALVRQLGVQLKSK